MTSVLSILGPTAYLMTFWQLFLPSGPFNPAVAVRYYTNWNKIWFVVERKLVWPQRLIQIYEWCKKLDVVSGHAQEIYPVLLSILITVLSMKHVKKHHEGQSHTTLSADCTWFTACSMTNSPSAIQSSINFDDQLFSKPIKQFDKLTLHDHSLLVVNL